MTLWVLSPHGLSLRFNISKILARFFSQVWRHAADNTYNMTHQFTSHVTQSGVHHVNLRTEDQVYVRADDVIGIYQSSTVQVFHDKITCRPSRSKPPFLLIPLPLPGSLTLTTGGDCRDYSIQVTYSTGMSYGLLHNDSQYTKHHPEIFSALLAFLVGNSPVTGDFSSQRSVTRSFGVFFDLRLSKWLSKQLKRWWFETPSRSLWRQCNDTAHDSIRLLCSL